MKDIQDTCQSVVLLRELSNELASCLYTLPEDVWRNPNQYGSGCAQWKLADVVAHLVSDSMMLRLSINRALKGIITSPMGQKDIMALDSVTRVVSLRVTLDEDLFTELYTSCKQLNTLLSELDQDKFEMQVWTPQSIVPISNLVRTRILELAVHTWDIKYPLDRSVEISQKAHSFLLDFLGTWLKTYFRKRDSLQPEASPVRYQFNLSDGEKKSYQFVINSDSFSMKYGKDPQPDVTYRCDTNTYLLLALGRIPFTRSLRRGLIEFDGNEALAAAFTERFSM